MVITATHMLKAGPVARGNSIFFEHPCGSTQFCACSSQVCLIALCVLIVMAYSSQASGGACSGIRVQRFCALGSIGSTGVRCSVTLEVPVLTSPSRSDPGFSGSSCSEAPDFASSECQVLTDYKVDAGGSPGRG